MKQPRNRENALRLFGTSSSGELKKGMEVFIDNPIDVASLDQIVI